MYLVNKDQNKLEPIEKTSFKAVGLKERRDLQEWIAKSPEVFGEELLIIQKEFDGFDETSERLDLLALDKQGNLVIIENKLDDSGRDVVWQVLKYSSYCSSLSTQQIREIFNRYLQKLGSTETAENLLEEFFSGTDYEDKLNVGNSQRIIMVSGGFRKEVTSTVLWLLNFGMRIQCFQASAMKLGAQLFFSIEQIIPMKGSEDYAISMASKNIDELSNQEDLRNRHLRRLEFWNQFLKENNKANNYTINSSPSRDQWIGTSAGMGGVNINIVISQKYARVEVYINRGEYEENKRIFDELFKMRDQIEQAFGDELVWERKDDKVTSRIKYQLDGVNAFDPNDWPKINTFLTDALDRFHKAFAKPIQVLRT